MRRIDHDGHIARQGPPPFRVLANNTYLSPPPPPAPEPYKVAPSSTSYGRAHRRSSFVILAETSPASPDAENAPSTLSTGRISPFRGRGFKGPPPRSMSRPQSPEVTGNGRRRGRGVERRVSVSQQNSPRRSLIPQPTYRQRSTSLTKDAERSPSPKIGRRADSKTRFNISNSRDRLNAADSKTRLNRSDSRSRTNLVEPRTRFISNSTSNLNGSATTTRRHTTTRASTRLSPIQGTPTKPEKTNARGRDSSRSPAKTPQRNNNNAAATRGANRNASKERVVSPSKIPLKTNKAANDASNTSRFTALPEQNSEQSKKADKAVKESKPVVQDSSGKSSEADVHKMEMDGNADEVDLRDLLKQTSQAIGTSSERLVNTTTTTAVQPLHIDANTLLVDGSTASQPKERIDAPVRSPASSKDASPVPPSTPNPTPSAENQPAKAESNADRNDKKESSTSADAVNVVSQNPAKSAKVNGEGSAQRSANQSANQRSARSNQNARASKQSDGKAAENVPEVVASRELPASDKMPTVMENEIAGAGQEAEGARIAAASNATNDATKSANAAAAVNASVNASGAAVRARNENRGSDASLKSSTGVSTNSIGSVRSTDTGVSVNTVRGVSSPREKTGVHMEKRSQEIETLSGNIVRVEQNGEPVLASGNEKQGDSEKLLARWGRSLSRYCKCCSGMRCLACRRDPKGLLWTKSKGRAMVINDSTPPPVAATALDAPPPTTSASWWSKLKTRCRCGRLREIKCCTRKARVAPAESPAACCPPERRCGAICRRVFDRCKCKRNADTQQRTRNTRAKHSITSVVPPPVSEEPKAKLPDVLVEHNSVMRGAIPCLPVPLAWFCLMWNVLLPGTGTVWSGLFNLCTGQPRFSPVAGMKSRLGALIVNLVVGVGQLFTVLFCLVGWGWSIWWGVNMVRLARKYKRFRASEAANNDLEARAGEPAAVPPGVPSQALREMERAR